MNLKGIICYYSITGNTEQACRYLKSKLTKACFDLHDIVKLGIPDFTGYDIAGFATWTDLHGAPAYFHSFFDAFPYQQCKPAFVFATYAMTYGRTLHDLAGLAQRNGFNVIAGHSLRAPESGPLMRKLKFSFDSLPSQNGLKGLDRFIDRLNIAIDKIRTNDVLENEPIGIGLVSTLIPPIPRKWAKKIWGIQKVDQSRCIKCGTCHDRCAYGAIRLEPGPIFNHDRCHGCCSCYHHCPQNAIYTSRVKEGFQRQKPNIDYLEKLYCA